MKIINQPDSDKSYLKPPTEVLDASPAIQKFVAELQKAAVDGDKTAEKLEAAKTTNTQLGETLAEAKKKIVELEAAPAAPDAGGDDADHSEGAEIFSLDLAKLTPVTDDMSRVTAETSSIFMHAETVNFRADSGYSPNLLDRARASLERALKRNFGSYDASGSQTYDALPEFDQANRVLVVFAVLGKDE